MKRQLYVSLAVWVFVAGATGPLAQGECVQLPHGAVAWWPAEGNADDLIGGHDGLTSGIDYAAGIVGQAFDFGYFQDYVAVPHHPELNLDSEYTIALWLNSPPTDSQTGHLTLVSKWFFSFTPYPYALRLGTPDFGRAPGTVLGASYDTVNAAVAETFTSLDDNTFHHVAMVFRHPEQTVDAYADGRLEESRQYPTPLGTMANSSDVYFGIRGNLISATDYDGLLDDIMFFDRALGVCEIAGLYAAGGAGVCSGDSDADGLADYEDNCPHTENPEQTDGDADGHGDACDCVPANPAYAVTPPEVCSLDVDRDGPVAQLSWPSLAAEGGSGTSYDVLTGSLDEFPVGIGASELCLENNLDALTAEDPQVLASGQGVWYLVRADGLCGDGSWGLVTSGVERITTVCQ